MDSIQRAVNQLFSTTSLVNKNGSPWNTSLQNSGVKIVAIYFSAHWCPPCRQFTPVLKTAFEEYKRSSTNNKMSVVFVSGDRSQDDMIAYMKEAHGDWPALSPGSSLQQSLNSAFQVRGIPSLIVVDINGEVLSREGRQEVMSMRSQAFQSWEGMFTDLDTSVVATLQDNPSDIMKGAAEILVKLLGNVIREPNNVKFRNIRLGNPKIESKLLVANGAFEILFSVGFEEGTDSLILPMSASIPLVTAFKTAIEKILNPSTSTNNNPGSSTSVASAPPDGNRSSNTTFLSDSNASAILGKNVTSEQKFLTKLRAEHQLCMAYENPEAQAKALEVIPLTKLHKAAKEKFEKIKNVEGSNTSNIADELVDDVFVIELLGWFKNEFFKWFDGYDCDSCTTITSDGSIKKLKAQPTGYDNANGTEAADGAGSVEKYTCTGCNKVFRFPRYHSRPEKLLTWRKGRCGEFANCFALILRSLGYDTRRVLDWTDHVWCEVYSKAEKRWLHADPCEVILDKPLVYEKGWGKKLSYCIATSKDEVQDVTSRYSIASSEDEKMALKARRNEVREDWLTKTLINASEEFQTNYEEADKKRLRERRLMEVIELMSPPKRAIATEEMQGRQTGSLAWRIERGELGGGGENEKFGGSFIPTAAEIEAKVFHLEFDVTENMYRRPLAGGKQNKLEGWQQGVKQAENIFRKVEHDWDMVYLARTEGATKASITWALDLSGTKLSVKTVELLVNSKTYENGRVLWQLCGANQCILPMPGVTMNSEQMNGSKELKVTAMLSGGKGDVAWQHAQLFRAEQTNNGNEDSKVEEKAQFKMIVKLQCDT